MRPEAPDIAVPPFPPGLDWVDGEPPAAERLTAVGPLLVHFFDFAQLNSVRALPYVVEWHKRYRSAGLAVVGVHSSRFAFTRPAAAVADAARRLGISHPIAVDAGYRIWHDYGCRAWPSLFLWRRGGVLGWYHFGEGDYRGTEEAIQAALAEARSGLELLDPMAPLRASDAPGALVVPPSDELFPGGSADRAWRPTPADPALEVEYAAGGVHATLDGEGEIQVSLDGAEPVRTPVEASGIYELAEHPRHEAHRLELRPSGGVRVWSISFAPGVPSARSSSAARGGAG